MSYKGKDYINIIVLFLIIFFVIQSFLSFISHEIGIFIFLGLLFYLMFFIYRDKRMKKEELNNILYYKRSWIGYNRKLPVEIP